MNNNPYQVGGPRPPRMLGRERLFEELRRHLTGITPRHMCVVGPPRFGKSVLLNHLASYFKDKSDHFVTTLYWNLGRHTPKTDDEFLRRFAAEIKDPLQSVRPELAEYLELEDGGLQEVFEDMKSEELRFLAVLDGFDEVVKESGITKYLWDEMTRFGEEGSLWLVTGSQRRLSELYTPEDSRRWNFSDIFYYAPLQVGCFEHHDWSGFLNPLKSRRGITCDASALKEIANWTGGVPVLSVALAEQIFNKFGDETISKSDVDGIAEKLDRELWPLLKDLWDDCPTDLQLDLVTLTRMEEVRLPKERHDDLKLRGFARESRQNRLRSSCRLMKNYAQQQEDEVETLHRLFGDAERFKSNIQSLLDLRLTQIRGADLRLMNRIKRAIESLQDDLIESIKLARSIEDRAMELIWEAELEPDGSIPEDWKSAQVCTQDQLPEERWAQWNILRLSTEKKLLKVITKPTQLFVDHLHWVGNFGHHIGRSTVSVPIAAAFCMSAISLCESLTRDLANIATEEEG